MGELTCLLCRAFQSMNMVCLNLLRSSLISFVSIFDFFHQHFCNYSIQILYMLRIYPSLIFTDNYKWYCVFIIGFWMFVFSALKCNRFLCWSYFLQPYRAHLLFLEVYNLFLNIFHPAFFYIIVLELDDSADLILFWVDLG